MGLSGSRAVCCEWCGKETGKREQTLCGTAELVKQRQWPRDCGCKQLVVTYASSVKPNVVERAELERDSKVLDLKEVIHVKEGVPSEIQRLFFKGREVDVSDQAELQSIGVRYLSKLIFDDGAKRNSFAPIG